MKTYFDPPVSSPKGIAENRSLPMKRCQPCPTVKPPRRPLAGLIALMLLAIFASSNVGLAADLYWRTDGTAGTWDSTFWNLGSATATGGTGWTSAADAFFTANSSLTFATNTVGNVTVSGEYTVTVTSAGTLTLGGVRTFDIGAGSTLTWTSQAQSTADTNEGAGIIKRGDGTLDWGAGPGTNVRYNGGFTLDAGTVIATGSNSLSTGVMTFNGGTFQSSGGVTYSSSSVVIGGDFAFAGTGNDIWGQTVNIGGSTRTITNNTTGTATRTFSNTISGSGGLTFAGTGGSGGIVLSGANDYSGPTTVGQGTLFISNVNASAAANQSLGTNTTVNLGVATTSSGTLVYTGAAGTLAKNINALGNGFDTIQNSGTGLLTLSGTLTKNGTTLTLKGGANKINVTGTITGASANSDLVIDGGTTTLSSANSYNGPTYIINGGTLEANATNALPTSPARSAIIMDQTGSGSSTLALIGTFDQSVASLAGASTSNINLNSHTLTVGTSSGSTTFAGVISGSDGSLIKDTAGSTLILTGSNTYTGTTTVNGGTLEIGTSGALTATSGVAINSGGTLLLNASNSVNSTATVTMDSGTLTLATTNGITQTFGALTLTGNSIIDFGSLTGTNSLYFAAGLGGAGTLAVYNWTAANDNLFFGSDNNALLPAALARISFFSDAGSEFLGFAAFNPENMGEVSPVPEPSAVLVGLSLLSLIGFRERRWFLRCREARRESAA